MPKTIHRHTSLPRCHERLQRPVQTRLGSIIPSLVELANVNPTNGLPHPASHLRLPRQPHQHRRSSRQSPRPHLHQPRCFPQILPTQHPTKLPSSRRLRPEIYGTRRTLARMLQSRLRRSGQHRRCSNLHPSCPRQP